MLPFDNRFAKKAFEQMKGALTEVVMQEVGQKLIKEGKKHQAEFIQKLTKFKEALKKEIIEELRQ